jgi:hypothetical protein
MVWVPSVAKAKAPAFVLSPTFGCDARRAKATECAEAVTRKFASLNARPLSSFGTNAVLVDYPAPVPAGDPAFTLAALNG